MTGKNNTTIQKTIDQDVRDLHRLGYAQQLYRQMGGFSNFAISFSIISILTGAILLFGYGLQFVGPIINTFGWPLVSLFTLTVAASMAELASAYPTAGGLYFWAYRLGGTKWAWVTAWFNMIGQVFITAGINYAAAIYIVGAVNRIFLVDLPTNTAAVIVAMIVIMIPQMLINMFGIRLTARLSDFSVYWHICGVLIIVLLLVLFGKYTQPFSTLFHGTITIHPNDLAGSFSAGPFTFESIMLKLPAVADFYTSSGLVFAFVLGLLQAQWTYTGYDASSHVAEEMVMARLNSAWGVFLSVAVSAIVGYILLIILTLHVPDIAATVSPANAPAVLYVVYENLLPLFAHTIAIIIGGAMWLCGLSSITSMSRMWFAFARDGGMPGYTLIKQIHPKWRTPIWAIVITSVLAVLLSAYAVIYSVVVAVSTTALYLAYAIPIYLNVRNKLRKQREFTTPETAPWNLKRWGIPINIVALLWVAFITLLFSIPPNELAGWSILLCCLFMFLYWHVDAKKHFTGPKILSGEELERLESELHA